MQTHQGQTYPTKGGVARLNELELPDNEVTKDMVADLKEKVVLMGVSTTIYPPKSKSLNHSQQNIL